MTTHATLSASISERWINCPGSVREARGIVAETSEYAAEGTAVHELIEWCLKEKAPRSQSAALKIGKTVNTIDPRTGRHFIVSAEMAENAQVFIDLVSSASAAADSSELFVEHKFNLNWLREEMFGTNDAMIVQKFGKMTVFDYKNGSGVMVSPEENSQLMYYGLGALGKDNPWCVEEVELVIVQPNGQGETVKRWSTTPEHLYKWAQETLLPAAIATDATDAPLHPGDWCRFCPAKVHCPALRRLAFESAELAFSSDSVPNVQEVRLVAPKELSNEKLGRLLAVTDILNSWFTEVRNVVHGKLNRGEDVPGWKLVQGRSSRSWRDAANAEAVLRTVYGEEIYDPKSLKSVAQMEKTLKAKKVDAATALDGLVEITHAKQMAPEGDKRPAVNAAANAEAFGEIPKELQ